MCLEGRETLPADVTQADFTSYVSGANGQLSPFDYEIRSSFHQSTRERIYALVNTTSDALTQVATTHSANEIAFVKRVLDAMFDKYNTEKAEVMSVTGMQALELAKGIPTERRESGTQAQGLTMKEAEKVLGELVAENWLDKSRYGYSLSPRALMELRGWLVETYNDEEDGGDVYQKIKFCRACKEIITVVSTSAC